MSDSTQQTKAHYGPLFSQFKADLGGGSIQFETDCLRYELSQIAGVAASGLVLDAGCGTGRYAAAWRQLFPSATVIGVDINDTILESGLIDPDSLTPIHGNLEALPFKTGAFDVVMSRGVIQHTSNPRQALLELLRVCKPGGLVYFYTYRHGWYDVILGVLRRIAQGFGAPFCSRRLFALCRFLRLDPRVPTMILDELLVPIRFAFSEQTIRAWLHASAVPVSSIQPVQHAQFAHLQLPVNRRTRWLHRVVPKNGLITLAVRTGRP
jgi:SAM-dependent methyltransferase